jgi:hypothetical protein
VYDQENKTLKRISIDLMQKVLQHVYAMKLLVELGSFDYVEEHKRLSHFSFITTATSVLSNIWFNNIISNEFAISIMPSW